MKVALGHVLNLLDKEIDFIFLPSVINLEKMDEGMTDSFVCPYVQSFPYTVRSAVDFAEAGVRVWDVPVYLQYREEQLVEAMDGIGRLLGCSPARVRQAVQAGLAALEQFQQALQRRGAEVLANLPSDKPAIVVVSRSYNGCDQGANLEIPRKLRNMGVLAIPMDFLPLNEVRLPKDWFNMYWRYGQKILAAAEIIARDDRLHALYLTNFGCGPDSFVSRFFQERMGDKPVLMIEVDEHSADAGVITRCEAFLDSLESAKGRRFNGGRHFRPLTIQPGTDRVVLIPNMSAHAFALKAAFEACGMRADVLPPPDEETLMWGRQYTTGKECFPCIVTTGDMVKFIKHGNFDRDRIAFFMGGSGGPCRFGQYNTLQRMVLDDLGYEDIPIFAPHQGSRFYDDLGIVGRKFLRIAWQGVVAVDLLEKARLQTRPYETEPGATNAAFEQSLEELCDAIVNGRPITYALRAARQRFAAVPVDHSRPRPVIGIVGEFYIRFSEFSNQNLLEKVEALGGECWVAPCYEWFLYRNFRRTMRGKLARDWKIVLKTGVMDWMMRSDEHRLVAAFDGFLRNGDEPPTETVLFYARPYVHHTFEGEAIMTVGKAIDFARKGLSGIIAVMPFTCMPGNIAQALMKRVRDDEDDIPFLNMVYDGLEQSTAQTRLEAFMYQAWEYMRLHHREPAKAH
jgi:predicted nucleotide-binding protein (sugar kinase/HSP70/actin superfamily)